MSAVGVAHPRIREQHAVAQRIGAIQGKQRAAAILMRIRDRPTADHCVHQTAAIAEELLTFAERQAIAAQEIEHVRQVERQIRFRLGQVVHVLRVHLILREDLAIRQQTKRLRPHIRTGELPVAEAPRHLNRRRVVPGLTLAAIARPDIQELRERPQRLRQRAIVGEIRVRLLVTGRNHRGRSDRLSQQRSQEQVRRIHLVQVDRRIQPGPAIPGVIHLHQELRDFALQVHTPVVDARRLAERRPHVIHGQPVADARPQERRRLVACRFRDPSVPLERRGQAVGNLCERSVCAQRAAASAIARSFVEDAEAAAQNRLRVDRIRKTRARPDSEKSVGQKRVTPSRFGPLPAKTYAPGKLLAAGIRGRERDGSHRGRIPVDRNVVAQAQVEGQLGRDLPIVLEVEAVILVPNISVLHRRRGRAGRIRQAQQEAGETVSRRARGRRVGSLVARENVGSVRPR